MKTRFKLIAFSLALCMVVTGFPIQALYPAAEEQPEQPYILYEVEQLRSKYSKTYLKSDGTYTSVSVGSAIHSWDEETKQWIEADNRLIKENGSYVNAESDMEVSLPEQLDSDSAVEIEYDNYKVSMTLDDAQKSNGRADNGKIQEKIQDSELKDSSAEDIAKTLGGAGELEYTDVFENTDIVYQIEGDRVKEDIVLYKKPDKSVSYTYRIKSENLIAVLNDDKSVSFYDSGEYAESAGSEEQFVIPAPNMYDANNEISYNISVTLEKQNGEYVLTYTPDYAWLNDNARAYPVKIDPTVEVKSSIVDLYTDGSTVKDNPSYHYVGKNNGKYYIRLSSEIPQIRGAVITKATVNIRQSNIENSPTSGGSVYTSIHNITHEWSTSGLATSEPTYDSFALDVVKNLYSQNGEYISYDITQAAAAWYGGSVRNYGLIIKLTNGSQNSGKYLEYYSMDCGGGSSYEPYFVFEYKYRGIDNEQTKSLNMNNAGIMKIDPVTGQTILDRADATVGGNIMPVDIHMIYNRYNSYYVYGTIGYRSDMDVYGYAVRTNYTQKLEYFSATNTTNEYFLYTLGDGSNIAFERDKSVTNSTQNAETEYFKDKSGSYTLCVVGYNGSGFTNSSDKYKSYITDSLNQKYYFDNSGRLKKIVGDYPELTKNVTRDSTPPSGQSYESGVIAFTYNNSVTKTSGAFAFNTITDGMGNVYTFNYENEGSYYYLKNITCGSKTLASYTSHVWNNCTYKAPLPTGISLYNGGSFTYTWKSNDAGTLNQVIDNTGTKYDFTYSGTDVQKIKTVKQTLSNGQVIQNVTVTYGAGYTKFSDSVTGNTEMYRYNNAGDVITIQDGDGNAVFMDYDDKTNELVGSSGVKKTVSNLLGDIESSDEVLQWNKTNAEYIIGYGYMSAKCFKITGSGNVRKSQLLPAGYYTFSAFVKTENAGGTYLDVSGNGIEHIQSRTVKGTNEYQRLFVTFKATVPSGSEDANATLKVVSSSGVTYVDAPQLESGETLGSYALLKNSDFESYVSGTNAYTPWENVSGVNQSGAPWQSSGADFAMIGKYQVDEEHGNSIWLLSGYETNCVVSQTVEIYGKQGDTFSFGGWSKGYGLPNKEDQSGDSQREYSITAIVENTGFDKKSEYKAEFNTSYHDWQYVMNEFTAEFDFNKITIQIKFNRQANYAFFDDVQLYREPLYGLTGSNYEDTSSGDDSSSGETGEEDDSQTFDENGNVIKEVSEEGVISEYEYNDQGERVVERTTNGRFSIETKTEYNSDGYIVLETNENGDTVSYGYDDCGNETLIKDENGIINNYSYNSKNLRTGINSGTGADKVTNLYTYDERDNLKKITTNNDQYNFNYNERGERTSIAVGSRTLVSYSYQDVYNSRACSAVNYSNGQKISYVFDDKGNVFSKSDGSDAYRFRYFYNSDGGLITILDDYSDIRTDFYTDADGNSCIAQKSFTGGADIIQDFTANTFESSHFALNEEHTRTIETDKDVRDVKITWNSENADLYLNLQYYYDDLNRISSKDLYTQGKNTDGSTTNNSENIVLTTSYTYKNQVGYKTTNDVVNIYQYNDNGLSISTPYSYAKNGLITKAGNVTYSYDSFGRLSRVNDPARGTFVYEYVNKSENISSVKKYAYTTGSLPSEYIITNYVYNDSNWKDLLTSYNGSAITYDQSGNPLSYYNGTTFTWRYGRQLATASVDNQQISFFYDNDGRRIKKSVGNSVENYHYTDDRLSFISGENNIYFNYDDEGMIGFNVYGDTQNPEQYFYVKNLQGDVIGILDEQGNLVVEYTYDAWGKVLAVTGSKASTIGKLNPIRYRGYYYDTDLELYYLQSRYYDPETGRFINADAPEILLDSCEVLSTNLFTYCCDDPVNNTDPTGYKKKAKTLEKYYEQKYHWRTRSSYDAIAIYIKKNNVYVIARAKIKGNIADNKIPNSNITYRAAIIRGIQKRWSGRYRVANKYRVKLITSVTDYGNKKQKKRLPKGARVLNITVKNQYGVSYHIVDEWKTSNAGAITLYKGYKDKNTVNAGPYDDSSFSCVAAHEFGHALGIGDLYPFYNKAQKYKSIMGNQEFKISNAYPADIHKMFSAYITNKAQPW